MLADGQLATKLLDLFFGTLACGRKLLHVVDCEYSQLLELATQ